MYAAAGIAPVDILLLLASSEGDAPKVVELLSAGATIDIKVLSFTYVYMVQACNVSCCCAMSCNV